jgi:hypothetical protein
MNMVSLYVDVELLSSFLRPVMWINKTLFKGYVYNIAHSIMDVEAIVLLAQSLILSQINMDMRYSRRYTIMESIR